MNWGCRSNDPLAATNRGTRGTVEIQAYDEACFPGLAEEWAKWDGLRPFVGTLTMDRRFHQVQSYDKHHR